MMAEDDPTSLIRTSFHLIKHIAIEPLVARYITEADIMSDSFRYRYGLGTYLPDIQSGEPVVELFASPPYLKEAGLRLEGVLCRYPRGS